MPKTQPKVSVVMPAYNAGSTIAETIDSILQQTFTDFEFIIIDDGSTDNTVALINHYNDQRIKLIRNEKNLDLVKTLNRGLEAAAGQYIVRIDADDIALPNRIERQVEFMDANPDIGVCGSWIKLFGGSDEEYHNPVEHDQIKVTLFFRNAIAHPSVIIRRSLLEQYGLRYEKYLAEDYDLWIRAGFCFKLHNLPEVLLNYRISGSSYSQTNSQRVWPVLNEILLANMAKLEVVPLSSQTELAKRVGLQLPLANVTELSHVLPLWVKLLRQNNKLNKYDTSFFNWELCRLWLIACDNSGVGRLARIWLAINFMLRSRSCYQTVMRYTKDLLFHK